MGPAIATVILFRQGYARELLTRLELSEFGYDVKGIPVTVNEATKCVAAGGIDLLVVGPTFIEEVPSIFPVGSPRPVTAVVTRMSSYGVTARALRVGVDVVADFSRGFEEALRQLHDDAVEVLGDSHRDARRHDESTLAHKTLVRVRDEIDREIVTMVATGWGDREIAEAVFLSHQTVRNRISRILFESSARNRTHLAYIYLQRRHEGVEPFESDANPDGVEQGIA